MFRNEKKQECSCTAISIFLFFSYQSHFSNAPSPNLCLYVSSRSRGQFPNKHMWEFLSVVCWTTIQYVQVIPRRETKAQFYGCVILTFYFIPICYVYRIYLQGLCVRSKLFYGCHWSGSLESVPIAFISTIVHMAIIREGTCWLLGKSMQKKNKKKSPKSSVCFPLFDNLGRSGALHSVDGAEHE